MKRSIGCLVLALSLSLAGRGFAQQDVTFCTAADGDCLVDTTLAVEFAGGGSTFEYDTFTAGTAVDSEVTIDTQTAQIQGWSIAVKHDPAILTLTSATTDGTIVDPTDANTIFNGGFNATSTIANGFISAIVLSFVLPAELPLGKNAVVKASYTLDADAGTAGTMIESVSGVIGPKNSPETEINLTVNGEARRPGKLTQGVVRLKGGAAVEICDNGTDDDADGQTDCDDTDCADDPACKAAVEICDNGTDDDADGQTDCDDSDCADDPACQVVGCPDWALYFGGAAAGGNVDASADSSVAISSRNKSAAFAVSLGVKVTANGDNWDLAFSGALGTDNNRLVELIITDDQGDSKTPQTPNTATVGFEPTTVARGSATAGFADGDFFAFDMAPGVGGSGFTVGYVSDLDDDVNKIAATGDVDCPVNEIFVVSGGAVGGMFSRGDADGNGKINVSDAVLIIQIVVGNLTERFDCDDALDADDSGDVSIADALPVLAWIFQRGPALPDPFLSCGVDSTGGSPATCAQSSPFCGP